MELTGGGSSKVMRLPFVSILALWDGKCECNPSCTQPAALALTSSSQVKREREKEREGERERESKNRKREGERGRKCVMFSH